MWCYAYRTWSNGKGTKLAEAYSKSPSLSDWGETANTQFNVKLEDISSSCNWEKNSLEHNRIEFCSLYEGYGQLCDCQHPLPINFFPPALDNSPINSVPVAVIAGNRPRLMDLYFKAEI